MDPEPCGKAPAGPEEASGMSSCCVPDEKVRSGRLTKVYAQCGK